MRHIKALLEQHRPALAPFVQLYKDLHKNPELSLQEVETAQVVSNKLSEIGYDVLKPVGGTGVVGILRNGHGPAVALRSELDALPVREDTGLPYASTKTMKNSNGKEQPVMHACGHDMHITCLLAAAEVLKSASSSWKGTVVCIFQPAEEVSRGAKNMVQDGLWDRVPVPSIILAQHATVEKAGAVMLRPGPVLASSDSVVIRVIGKGGHGARPQSTIDPIFIGSNIVVRLQGIISREIDPAEVAIITCGSFHAGTRANIIPDEAILRLTVRTFLPKIREQVLEAIKRVAVYEAKASGATEEPKVIIRPSNPATINDGEATSLLQGAFKDHFGSDLSLGKPGTASEDFCNLAIPINVPYVYWQLGCIDADKWKEAERLGKISDLPANHSSKFAPAIQPTLRTGLDAMALAALTFLHIDTSHHENLRGPSL